MQVEALAQHPRVVGQQEVVQDQVQSNTATLEVEERGSGTDYTGQDKNSPWECWGRRLTSFRCMTCVSPSTTPYQSSQRRLLAAKEANRFMCSVIREHFNDLYMVWEVVGGNEKHIIK